MIDFNSHFGSIVRQMREGKYSQRKLAELLNITPTYLSKIERGEFKPPSEDVIKRIANIFDVNSDELLASADKVDSELIENIKQSPVYWGRIIRED